MVNRRDVLKLGVVTAAGLLAAACGDPGPGPGPRPTERPKPTVDSEIDKKIAEWDAFRRSALPSYDDLMQDVFYSQEASAIHTPRVGRLAEFAAIEDADQKVLRVLTYFGVETAEGLQLPRWSVPTITKDNGEKVTRYKCNIYAAQVAMALTYGVDSSGDVAVSNIFSRDLKQPYIWSMGVNSSQVVVQRDANEMGDWLAGEGQNHGWHPIGNDEDMTKSLDGNEVVYGVMDGHNYLLMKLRGKVICSQATDDRMMESEDEMVKRGVEWKMKTGVGVRFFWTQDGRSSKSGYAGVRGAGERPIFLGLAFLSSGHIMTGCG